MALELKPTMIRCCAAGAVAVSSDTGVVTLLDPRLVARWQRAFRQKPSCLALSPGGGRIAFGGPRELTIVAIDREDALAVIDGYFDDAWFSTEDEVWTVRACDNGIGHLACFDLTSKEVTMRVDVDAPLAVPAFSLHAQPNGMPCVWAPAGQDGQNLYSVSRGPTASATPLAVQDDAGVVVRDTGLVDTNPPDFSPDGTELLTVRRHVAFDRDIEVIRVRFPSFEEIGSLTWEPEDDDDHPSGAFYVANGRAVVHTGAGRLRLIDVDRMVLLDEVAVVGHEPRWDPDENPWSVSTDFSFPVGLASRERLILKFDGRDGLVVISPVDWLG